MAYRPGTRRSSSPEPAKPPRVPWAEVCDYFYRKHQLGEHVAIEGPTGSGKSVLALLLLEARGKRGATDGRPTRITVLAVKPRDQTLSLLPWPRLTSTDEWGRYGNEQVILWPRYGDANTAAARQSAFFEPVLRHIMAEGRQIVYIDEAAYFEEAKPNGLGLASLLNQFWYMSRGNKVSLMAATQRPRRVSRSMWSEPYWLFIFRPEDEDDLKRVAQLSGSKELVLNIVPTLETHEFLMLRRRPVREAIVSQVDLG